MSTYYIRWARFVGITAVAIYCVSAASPSNADVKLIGGFEGTMASGYPPVPDGTGKTPAMDDPDMDPDPANWFTDVHITTPPQFITADDLQYGGGVTQGDQALLFTFPQSWAFPNTAPFFRLHGHVSLLNDTADFPYLMLDITTFGHPETPADDYPLFRQVFPIFNGSRIGFYDRTLGDIDVQQDIPPGGVGIASGSEAFRTYTLVVDMTGPPVPYPHTSNDDTVGDGKTSMKYLADRVRTDHTDGTPIADISWQLLFAFQGDDEGDPAGVQQIKVVIDNIRFCTENNSAACQVAPAGLPGDYNDDGTVDAADYVVWRKTNGSGASLPNDDTPGVGPDDYTRWVTNFGTSSEGGGAGASAVPEPTSGLLGLVAAACLLAIRRR